MGEGSRRQSRLWCLAFVTGLALCLVGLHDPTVRAQPNLCSLLPPDFTSGGTADGQLTAAQARDAASVGQVANCFGTKIIDRSTTYGVVINIGWYNSVAAAQQLLSIPVSVNYPSADPPRMHPSDAFGDEGAEAVGTDPNYQITGGYYRFAFRRGCYVVFGSNTYNGPSPQTLDASLVRNLALDLDQKLKGMPQCPGEQTTAKLEAGLACDDTELQTVADHVET